MLKVNRRNFIAKLATGAAALAVMPAKLLEAKLPIDDVSRIEALSRAGGGTIENEHLVFTRTLNLDAIKNIRIINCFIECKLAVWAASSVAWPHRHNEFKRCILAWSSDSTAIASAERYHWRGF